MFFIQYKYTTILKLYSKMNGTELFERMQQGSTFDELLQSVNGKTKIETQSKRGNLFEKVWDIIIKLGFYSNRRITNTRLV